MWCVAGLWWQVLPWCVAGEAVVVVVVVGVGEVRPVVWWVVVVEGGSACGWDEL